MNTYTNNKVSEIAWSIEDLIYAISNALSVGEATLVKTGVAMLRDYADILRAREEANPVAWVSPDGLSSLKEKNSADFGFVQLHVENVVNFPNEKQSVPLFYHPPTESAEAKDAARYRKFRDHGTSYNNWIRLKSLENNDDFDAFIDAMTAESHEGEE